ncbi:MAG: aminotransferase class IV [Rickettsiales bacterium]
MSKYIYLNGKYFEDQKRLISTHDRGLRFGDGLFETIRISNGKIYQWNFHIARLKKGLDILKIRNVTLHNIKDHACALIQKNHVNNGLLKIIVTAGEKSVGYSRMKNSPANIIIETNEKNILWKEPVQVIISSIPKPNPESIPTQVKTLANLNSVLAKIEAEENNCFDGIQLDNKKYICEFSSGNIFWVKNKVLYTPSNKCPLIRGVIRNQILKSDGIRVNQGVFPINNLLTADEIFMTNANHIILPISEIKNEWKGNQFTFTKNLFHHLESDIASI